MDRGGLGHDEALLAARNQMLGMAGKDPLLARIRPDGLEDASQLEVTIDREKAASQGVGFAADQRGDLHRLRLELRQRLPERRTPATRVVVQADQQARMQPDDLLRLNAINANGQPVPLSAFAAVRWVTGPVQSIRYKERLSRPCASPAMRRRGTARARRWPRCSSLRRICRPASATSGRASRARKKLSGLYRADPARVPSLLAVFLCLAALYESWSIPMSVLLVVPIGVLGALLGAWTRGFSNDVYFKVGLITIIGLSAKNAVLIIELRRKTCRPRARAPPSRRSRPSACASAPSS